MIIASHGSMSCMNVINSGICSKTKVKQLMPISQDSGCKLTIAIMTRKDGQLLSRMKWYKTSLYLAYETIISKSVYCVRPASL